MCLLFENTLNWYTFTSLRLNPRSIFPIMAEHIICDVIYNSADYHCDQGNKNESQDLGELGFHLGFHQISTCQPHRLQTLENFLSVIRIAISDFYEDQSVHMKANKLLLSPLWRVLCRCRHTTVTCVFLPIRLRVTATDDSKFMLCQFFSKLLICTLYLSYFCMKIRFLISFELLLLFVHCKIQRVLLSLPHTGEMLIQSSK